MGKNSHQEILVILCYDLLLLPWGFFSAFYHWNFLPATHSLSGKCLFGNAAFQINAIIIHTVSLLLLFQVSPFAFMHTPPARSLYQAFSSTGVRSRGRNGQGSPELARGGSAWRSTFETRCGVIKNTVMKISIQPPFWMVFRNFVYGGHKYLYIYWKSFFFN